MHGVRIYARKTLHNPRNHRQISKCFDHLAMPLALEVHDAEIDDGSQVGEPVHDLQVIVGVVGMHRVRIQPHYLRIAVAGAHEDVAVVQVGNGGRGARDA